MPTPPAAAAVTSTAKPSTQIAFDLLLFFGPAVSSCPFQIASAAGTNSSATLRANASPSTTPATELSSAPMAATKLPSSAAQQ